MFSFEIGDTELIAAVLNGDNEAFAGLVSRHQRQVAGFCLSMLSDAQAAEDAAQDVFVKAFIALPGFRGGASFSTWLYRIAYNHCCSLRRKTARARQESLDAMPEAARETALRAAAEEETPHTAPVDPETALGALPPAYRAVIAMRLEGLSYSDIAASLEVSVDSVKARLKRARIILRARLRHLLPEEVSKCTEEK